MTRFGFTEVFTPGRKGAKRNQLKALFSFPNLGGLAALRDTSQTKSGEGVFTLGSKGAKSRDRSKRRRFLRHAVGDTLNTVFDQMVTEVDQEAKSFVHQAQIGQDLFAVHSIKRRDRFYFNDYAVVDDQVGAKAFVERDPFPSNRNRHLPFHEVAVFAQLMRKRDFVYDFEDAWPKFGVQSVSSFDNPSRDFILFHARKPALVLLACEAKNVCARTEFFTPRRKGAKNSYKSRKRISGPNLGDLAALRETSAIKK